MGRSQANVQFSIFDGLLGLSLEAKILYFRILVEETVSQAGIGALRTSLWSRTSDLSLADTEKALQELDDKRFVFVDHETEQILIRTLIRNDGIADVPNVLWAACRAALQVRSTRLRRELAAELRKLPPKPADKLNEKTGRTYVYPDPHATADAIDPGPPVGPGRRSESHPASHPEPMNEIPSTSHVEPIESGAFRDPIDMGSRTPGGGGGGGGGGETPVGINSTSENKLSRASRSRREVEPVGFDDFWAAYPSKVGKIKAQAAYEKALSKGAEPSDLLSGARRYARWIQAAGKQDFTAHPTTWLNRGGWEDELSEAPAELRLVAGQRIPTTTQRVQAALAFLEPEDTA